MTIEALCGWGSSKNWALWLFNLFFQTTRAPGPVFIQAFVTGSHEYAMSSITPLIWILSHLHSDLTYLLQVKFQQNRTDSKWFLPMEVDRRGSNNCSSKACRSLAIPLFCHCQFVLPFDMHVICIMHIWSTALILPLPFPSLPPLPPFPWYSLITDAISCYSVLCIFVFPAFISICAARRMRDILFRFKQEITLSSDNPYQKVCEML